MIRHINCAVILFFSLSLLQSIKALPNVTTEVSNPNNTNELKQVHVIFAHKLQAPLKTGVKHGFPDNLDYQYFLQNTLEMTNKSKMDMFNFGVELRQKYDKFLGGIYYPEVMQMRTSEYFLSMISGLLVNAGLWPPEPSQKWKEDLDWQPIPTDYEQMAKDTLFLGSFCPHFRAEEKSILEDKSIKDQISVHDQFFSFVTKNYGKKITHPSEVALIYASLETMAEIPNATLPAWAEGMFPYGEMKNVSLISYDLLSRSSTQKKLNGGGFLKKIIGDSNKIATAKKLNQTLKEKKHSRDFKISMYSGEERNVVGVLKALNLWSPHVLANGASVILELRHNNNTNIYGFEIYYYTGVEDNETIALSLPGCGPFCPLKDFARILNEVLPTDENLLCHTVPPPPPPAKGGKTGSSAHRSYNQPLFLSHFFVPLISLLFSKF